MTTWMKIILFCCLLVAFCPKPDTLRADEQKRRWVYFAYDKNLGETTYYYDPETMAYLNDNRVSVWLKVASQGNEELIHTEIECSGSMFRTVQPYKPFLEKIDKTSYAVYGWLEIPPDSEIHLLKKAVCKPKQ